MKLNSKILQKYAETQLRPPPMEGADIAIPDHDKLPEIGKLNLEELAKKLHMYERDQPFVDMIKDHKRRKQVQEMYPDFSPEKIEEYLAHEKAQNVMPPEQRGEMPTFSQDSAIDMLISKYGTGSVVLPPVSEDVLNEEIINDPEFGEIPDIEEIDQISLRPPALPQIKPISDQEMKRWEHWINSTNTQKEYDHGGSLGKEDSTIPPPPKNASLDMILKSCHAFYVLSRK